MKYFLTNVFVLCLTFCFHTSSSQFAGVNYDNETLSQLEDYPHERQSRSHDYRKKLTIAAINVIFLLCNHPDDDKKSEKKCVLNVQELPLNYPLIIDPADHTKFLYPDADGNIYFFQNDPVFMSCGMQDNKFKNFAERYYETFYCDCGHTFKYRTRKFDIRQLECWDYPKSVDRHRQRLGNHYKFEIGFYTEPDTFLKIIDLYLNEENQLPAYTISEIPKSIEGGQNPLVTVKHKPSRCCKGPTVTINEAMMEDSQEESFRNQLSSEKYAEDNEKYLYKNTDFVFTRSYLTPRETMIYSVAAIATYSHLNVAPIWLTMQVHNWGNVEKHALDMASTLNKDLLVITGTYGQLRLEDKFINLCKSIYLYSIWRNSTLFNKYPIPLWFYKIIIEPTSKEGVVYVTLNNPYIKSKPDVLLCRNPFRVKDGEKTPPIWGPENFIFGYSYYCKVSDFLRETGLTFDNPIVSSVDHLLYINDGSFFKIPFVDDTDCESCLRTTPKPKTNNEAEFK